MIGACDVREGGQRIRFVLPRLLLLFILFMLNVKFISHMTRISFELHLMAESICSGDTRTGDKFVSYEVLKMEME